MRSRAINAVGAAMSGTVLLVVLVTKFPQGAGYAIAAMVVLFVVMTRIRRHYDQVRDELAVSEGDTKHQLLPSRVHAIVLVSKIHKPTLRALSYARATRPSILEALTVDVDPDETRALQAEWDRRDIPVPLKALDSPFREITRPIVDYVKSIRSGNPRDLVVVYIPRVRPRPLVGAAPPQPERPAAQGDACSSHRASWSPRSRGSWPRPRAPKTGWTVRSSATSAAARADVGTPPGRPRRR